MDSYISQLNSDLQEQQVIFNRRSYFCCSPLIFSMYIERSHVSPKGLCDRWRYSRYSRLPRPGASFCWKNTERRIFLFNFFGLQTLIAIKAPSGTTLAVPYPDESVPPNRRKYQIFLKSNDGPVDIYLVNSPRVRFRSIWKLILKLRNGRDRRLT